MRYTALVSYAIAAVFVVVALVLGVREIAVGSAVGGVAALFIALIMLATISWRVRALIRRGRSDASGS